MRLSGAGLELIAKWEGFRAEPYNDVAGHATIGYGHLLHHGPVTFEDRKRWGSISRSRGLSLLRDDAAIAEKAVNEYVRVKITQNQFDALVSFTFNVGVGAFTSSTLLKKLNKRDYKGACDEFGKWVNAGGRPVQGLVNRRREEAELFASASPQDRKREVWQERLDKLRRVAESRRKAGKNPWPLGMRVRARIYKRLLRRQ